VPVRLWLLTGQYLAAARATAASAPTVSLTNPGFWLTGAERGLMLVGLSVALGGLAGQGLARQFKGSSPAPLPPPWALRGCLLGLAASVALVLTALAAPGLAADLARPPAFGLPSSATAVIAGVEAVCFAVAAVLLRLRQPSRSVPLLIGVVVAEAVRAHPEGIVPVAGAFLTICHVLPAVLWAGLLGYVLRAAIAWRADPMAVRGLIKLYGAAAAWLVAVILVTGLISAALLVPLGSLLTTTYGLFLVAKAALVAVAGCLAIVGRVWLRRRSEPGAGPARATRLECAVLAAVLAVTGILTVLTPPAGPLTGQATARSAGPAVPRHRGSGRSAISWPPPPCQAAGRRPPRPAGPRCAG
jgi:copper transport protein